MSSLRDRIFDDEQDYEQLCAAFGEPVQRTANGVFPDPYCAHAKRLRARRDAGELLNKKPPEGGT